MSYGVPEKKESGWGKNTKASRNDNKFLKKAGRKARRLAWKQRSQDLPSNRHNGYQY